MGQAPGTLKKASSKKDLQNHSRETDPASSQGPSTSRNPGPSNAGPVLEPFIVRSSLRRPTVSKFAVDQRRRRLIDGFSRLFSHLSLALAKTAVDPFSAAAILALTTGLLNFFLLGQPIPLFKELSTTINFFRHKDHTPIPGSLQQVGKVVQQPVKLMEIRPEPHSSTKSTEQASKATSTSSSTESAGTKTVYLEDKGWQPMIKFGEGDKHPLYYRDPEGCGPVYDPKVFFKARNFNKLTWNPDPNKFLFAYCFRGQISNRILCFRNTMILAALLNRTLVVPMRNEEQYEHVYDMRIVFHLDSARQCLGEKSMMSTEEYEKKFHEKVTLDRLQCWHGPNQTCKATPGKKDKDCPAFPYAGQELNSSEPVNMTYLGIPTKPLRLDPESHMATHFIANPGLPIQGLCLGPNISFEDAVTSFARYKDKILSVGDMVDRFLTDPLLHLPFLELVFNLNKECQTWKGSILSPPPQLLSRSYNIQRQLFGSEEYMAIHWRRGDFALYCFNAIKSNTCFYSPRQAANCTIRLAHKYGLRNIFLATNAPPDELKVFLDYVEKNSNGEVKIRSAPHLWENVVDQERWIRDNFPGGNLTEQAQLAEATNQKLICARSRIFVGAQESTFTRDIMHLRFAMRKINCMDQLLCYQEAEWEDDNTGLTPKELEMKLDWKRRTALHMQRMKEKEERRKKAEEARKKKEADEARRREAEAKKMQGSVQIKDTVKVEIKKETITAPVKKVPMLD